MGRKKLLNLILVAILAIQPVFFSYAMAGMMSHTQNVITSDTGEHHAHHDMHAMHMDMSQQTHVQPDNSDTEHKHGSFADDCCDNAACGFATLMNISFSLAEHHDEYISFLDTPKSSAELSGMLRPPRS